MGIQRRTAQVEECGSKRGHATKSPCDRQHKNGAERYPYYGTQCTIVASQRGFARAFRYFLCRHQVTVRLMGLITRTIFIAVFAILAGSVFLGNCSDSVSADSIAQRAKRLAQKGRVSEALNLLHTTLSAHPADLEARLALAEIYAGTGKGDQAEQEFREALRLHPESTRAELSVSEFYIDAGSWSAADSLLTEVLLRHPKLGEARLQFALVLARERKYKDAMSNIRLVAPPMNGGARVRYFRLLASIDSGLGDSKAAAHAIEKALQVTPADKELQLVTAISEAEAGEWMACIRNILPLHKETPTAQNGLILLRAQLASHQSFESTLLELRGLDLPDEEKLQLRIHSAELLSSADQHKEAAKDFRSALNMAGSGDESLLYNLAVEEYASGQFSEALETVRLLRGRVDSAETEDLLGDLEEVQGERSAAVQSHEKAVALAPDEEKFRLSLGAELLKYRDYKPAVAVFEQASVRFPNSARILVGLGMAQYFLEQYDDSVSSFLHADELDQRSGRALAYLGGTQVENPAGPNPVAVDAICRRANANSKESAAATWCGALLFRKAYLAGDQSVAPDAIRHLRTATDLNSRDADASCALGNALEWIHQMSEARHWMEICVQLRPDSPRDHYRLSRIYRKLGLKQAAAQETRLTDLANTVQGHQDTIADQFAREMVDQSDRGKTSKQPREPR